MASNTDIRLYYHTNLNAPELTPEFGKLNALLKTVLVDGFTIGDVASVTAVDKIVTLDFGYNHTLTICQVVEISGANEVEFNGVFKVVAVPSTTSIQVKLQNNATVSTATGLIICKLPSLGWECPFSSGGRAAYRSANTDNPNRPYLRIVDEQDSLWNSAYSKYAKVALVEEMADIDTLGGVIVPYDSANPDKNWVATGSGATVINGWAKWYYGYNDANGDSIFRYSNSPAYSDILTVPSGVRKWVIVGDKDTFYIFNTASPNSVYIPYGFGKFESYFEGDVFNHFLSCSLFYNPANTLSSTAFRGQTTGLQGGYGSLLLQRPISGAANYITGQITANKLSVTGVTNIIAAVASFNKVFSAQADLFSENTFRGYLPYLNWVYQAKPYPELSIFEDSGEYFIAINHISTTTNTGTQPGQSFISLGVL
ncbi:hypothetical protein NQU59_09350 [Acinetobacter colistiniresistens]|uniref:hypothetical protein n=1 Tax=Acinetobacter colistiniresistens TaxID=280145 RepID=UPI00211B7E55|nr:hypothetical protein [Acinetobacter colistiniresistens]UUM25960.1 hypothetical protein NQU59_09350 [Acinetobacter colistiniresistens]